MCGGERIECKYVGVATARTVKIEIKTKKKSRNEPEKEKHEEIGINIHELIVSKIQPTSNSKNLVAVLLLSALAVRIPTMEIFYKHRLCKRWEEM